MFMSECQQVYAQMTKADFKTTHGDEFIISLAAVKFNVKNAGAYIYRFWTGSQYNPQVLFVGFFPAISAMMNVSIFTSVLSSGLLIIYLILLKFKST